MAQTDLAAVAKRLYERFLAPLVVGGELTPGPAVGPKAALELDGGTSAVDPDVRSRVDLARVRVARRLIPVDTVPDPSTADWALAAALHDLVHSLHPELDGVLHRKAPDRLLDFAEQVIERVPPASSLEDVLLRHTFFARTFEIQRTDTFLSWWTGSRKFLGTDPPPRLVAWPGRRRVPKELTTDRRGELPDVLQAGRRERFRRLLTQWLEKVPLTDLATCDREVSPFRWTGAALGLFATPGGRVLGLRALGLGPPAAVDAALGRASAAHVKAAAWGDVARIGDVLAERALASAASDQSAAGGGGAGGAGVSGTEVSDEAHYAHVLGAITALARPDDVSFSAVSARRIAAKLVPLAQSLLGRELGELFRNAGLVAP